MKSWSYAGAGVDIDAADAAKRSMADGALPHPLVLNRHGAFASVLSADFAGYREPVLVMKTEEPGSKMALALQHGRVESLARDLVHHLLNDIAVMGARPLYVQDAILCGKLEPALVSALVAAIAACCREHGCALTGGETSEQPGVLAAGAYMLTASVVGVAERERLIDGSAIRAGDTVLAFASNGLHTNGYSLVRALLAAQPHLLERDVDGEPLLEALLRPHRSYYPLLRSRFGDRRLHGLAHITGGGIAGNLRRILPAGLDAVIDGARVRPSALFRLLRDAGGLNEADMLRTFNMGVGLIAVAAPELAAEWTSEQADRECRVWPIGTIVEGTGEVTFSGKIDWRDER